MGSFHGYESVWPQTETQSSGEPETDKPSDSGGVVVSVKNVGEVVAVPVALELSAVEKARNVLRFIWGKIMTDPNEARRRAKGYPVISGRRE